jgi:homoserine O-acetyltransferase/O-succinyltransferase
LVAVSDEFPALAQTRARATTRASRVPVPARPPVPASSAWRSGDPVGGRRFADLGPFALESGGRLPAVRLAYETWGTLNEEGTNAVLVLHALTGDSHVIGDADEAHPTPGWWSSMVGPGAPIDTDEWFVVAPNVLGGCQGSTGPSSLAPDGRPWGSRFPLLTVRDQVAAEVRLADLLGVDTWALVIGASMGGLRVLEWAASEPQRVEAFAAIATAAQTSGDQIASFHTQLAAITADPRFRGGDYYDAPHGEGPHAGLGLARQIAHQTYRSAYELDERFGRIPQGGEDPLEGGRFAVQSYLDHHGDKLTRRFDANTYVTLTRSMITHDLGRDRGGVEAALATITARGLVIAFDTDRLFPPAQSERIAAGVPGAGPVRTVHSDYGHDGFLIEEDQVGQHVTAFLRDSVRAL